MKNDLYKVIVEFKENDIPQEIIVKANELNGFLKALEMVDNIENYRVENIKE